MPWSTPLAEPLGFAAGFIAGEVVHRFAHRIAYRFNLSETQVTFLGTAATHFVVAAATKGMANIACGDPIGLGLNPLTSLATAVTHGTLRVGFDKLADTHESDSMMMPIQRAAG